MLKPVTLSVEIKVRLLAWMAVSVTEAPAPRRMFSMLVNVMCVRSTEPLEA